MHHPNAHVLIIPYKICYKYRSKLIYKHYIIFRKEQGKIAHTKCLPIDLCNNWNLYTSKQILTDFIIKYKNSIDDTFSRIFFHSMFNILVLKID